MLPLRSRRLLLLLSALVALGPMSTDLYLPALPAMVGALATDVPAVQLTISSYLVGFALFHLVCGPLADRYGRRPVLLGGLVLFVLASVGCALAADIRSLIVWRFVQGVGACTGPTLARAAIRDIHGGQAARALALLAAIMALAPVVAPTLGGWLLSIASWRSLFWLLCVYALVTMLAVWRWVPETLPHVQSLRPRVIGANMLRLVGSAAFTLPVLAASLHYAGAFAFLSGASFVLIDFYGVPPTQFGLWFMFIVVGYILGNLFSARFGARWSSLSSMQGGALLGGIAGSLMAVLAWCEVHHPLAVVVPMALYTASVGITLPQAMADAMMPFARMAGTASALLGFVQMGVAAVAGAIVGVTLGESALAMSLVIAVLGWSTLLCFMIHSRWQRA